MHEEQEIVGNDNKKELYMATEDNFIVAIDLGSSMVTGIAGCKEPDGAIKILAFVQEPSDSFIRRGRVQNVDKLTQCIRNLKKDLEKRLDKSISQVYVGIGGMGMHTVGNSLTKNFPEKVVITQNMVDEMLDINLKSCGGEREILDVVPQEYKVGTQFQLDPVGVLTDRVEGRYLNVVASPDMRQQIENCFRSAGVAIADMPITVQELAETVLSESEKRSGCVFVDMGAETTSVAVYKNNILRHLAVIPLGGANINRDIMSLQIDEEEAESLKLTYGSARCDCGEEEHAPIVLRDGRNIKYEEFCLLVEARMEEIILNISHQIALSKYDKNQLIGGIIITGGTANIKDIEKAITAHTKFEKLRFVKNLRMTLRTKIADFNKNGSCNAAIALVEQGTQNCCGGSLDSPNNALFPTAEELKKQQEAEAAAAAEKEAAEKAAEAEKERLEQEEAERRAREEKRNGWRKKFHSFIDRLTAVVSDEDSFKKSENAEKESENPDEK